MSQQRITDMDSFSQGPLLRRISDSTGKNWRPLTPPAGRSRGMSSFNVFDSTLLNRSQNQTADDSNHMSQSVVLDRRPLTPQERGNDNDSGPAVPARPPIRRSSYGMTQSESAQFAADLTRLAISSSGVTLPGHHDSLGIGHGSSGPGSSSLSGAPGGQSSRVNVAGLPSDLEGSVVKGQSSGLTIVHPTAPPPGRGAQRSRTNPASSPRSNKTPPKTSRTSNKHLKGIKEQQQRDQQQNNFATGSALAPIISNRSQMSSASAASQSVSNGVTGSSAASASNKSDHESRDRMSDPIPTKRISHNSVATGKESGTERKETTERKECDRAANLNNNNNFNNFGPQDSRGGDSRGGTSFGVQESGKSNFSNLSRWSGKVSGIDKLRGLLERKSVPQVTNLFSSVPSSVSNNAPSSVSNNSQNSNLGSGVLGGSSQGVVGAGTFNNNNVLPNGGVGDLLRPVTSRISGRGTPPDSAAALNHGGQSTPLSLNGGTPKDTPSSRFSQFLKNVLSSSSQNGTTDKRRFSLGTDTKSISSVGSANNSGTNISGGRNNASANSSTSGGNQRQNFDMNVNRSRSDGFVGFFSNHNDGGPGHGGILPTESGKSDQDCNPNPKKSSTITKRISEILSSTLSGNRKQSASQNRASENRHSQVGAQNRFSEASQGKLAGRNTATTNATNRNTATTLGASTNLTDVEKLDRRETDDCLGNSNALLGNSNANGPGAALLARSLTEPTSQQSVSNSAGGEKKSLVEFSEAVESGSMKANNDRTEENTHALLPGIVNHNADDSTTLGGINGKSSAMTSGTTNNHGPPTKVTATATKSTTDKSPVSDHHGNIMDLDEKSPRPVENAQKVVNSNTRPTSTLHVTCGPTSSATAISSSIVSSVDMASVGGKTPTTRDGSVMSNTLETMMKIEQGKFAEAKVFGPNMESSKLGPTTSLGMESLLESSKVTSHSIGKTDSGIAPTNSYDSDTTKSSKITKSDFKSGTKATGGVSRNSGVSAGNSAQSGPAGRNSGNSNQSPIVGVLRKISAQSSSVTQPFIRGGSRAGTEHSDARTSHTRGTCEEKFNQHSGQHGEKPGTESSTRKPGESEVRSPRSSQRELRSQGSDSAPASPRTPTSPRTSNSLGVVDNIFSPNNIFVENIFKDVTSFRELISHDSSSGFQSGHNLAAITSANTQNTVSAGGAFTQSAAGQLTQQSSAFTQTSFTQTSSKLTQQSSKFSQQETGLKETAGSKETGLGERLWGSLTGGKDFGLAKKSTDIGNHITTRKSEITNSGTTRKSEITNSGTTRKSEVAAGAVFGQTSGPMSESAGLKASVFGHGQTVIMSSAAGTASGPIAGNPVTESAKMVTESAKMVKVCSPQISSENTSERQGASNNASSQASKEKYDSVQVLSIPGIGIGKPDTNNGKTDTNIGTLGIGGKDANITRVESPDLFKPMVSVVSTMAPASTADPSTPHAAKSEPETPMAFVPTA